MLLEIAFALVFFAVAGGIPLPSYMTPCRADDPKLSECALEQAIKSMPHILDGDPTYGIPSFRPLKLSTIELSTGSGLKIIAKNLNAMGVETTKFKELTIDLNKKNWKATVVMDYLELLGDYEMNGQILVLPLVGQGKCNVTLENPIFSFEFDYDLITAKDGLEYMVIKNSKAIHPIAKTYFYFSNLFNGDKALGDQTNVFLNENWEPVTTELNGAFSETINALLQRVLGNLLSKVPYSEIVKF